MLSLRERMELDLEARIIGKTLVLSRSLDPLYGDYIELNDLNVLLELIRNQVDDLEPTVEEGKVVDKLMIEEVNTINDDKLVSKFFRYPSHYDEDEKILVEDMDLYLDEGIEGPFCDITCVETRSDGIEWWWHLYGGDGGRRNKAFLHMLCVLDGFLDVLVKSVKLVKFLLYLVSSHGWLGLSTQPTPKELDRWESWFRVHELEKVKALGANGDMSDSRVGVVWMEVVGGIERARVVSRVMGELSLEEMLMKSVRGIFFGGFWVEELALEAIEYDDQGMRYYEGCLQGTLLLRWVEVGSCKEWVQECSCSRDHSPPLGEELEKAIRMTRCLEELELGDEAFFPYP
ncbi:hypothetical protein Tco_0535937 [Tanacetum coccineum]